MLTAVSPSPAQPTLVRQSAPGLDVTTVSLPTHREFHITMRPLAGETLTGFLDRLRAVLDENRALVVKQEVFGSLVARNKVTSLLACFCDGADWPVTWLEGGSCGSSPVAGLHLLAISGAPVESIAFQGRTVGRMFSDSFVNHCLVGDILPNDMARSPADQAWQFFKNLEGALEGAGMDFTNLVRTWIYLDRLLSWYGPFNIVRKEFFRQRQVFAGLIPASTGIGGKNHAGAAALGAGWAVQPLKDSVVVREVPSPLQCPAPNYGSCFSRALEIVTPLHRRLFISGTASIDAGGRSVHLGRARAQIRKTMEVVEAILASRNMDFSDVTRATGYFKHAKDAPLLDAWCAQHGVNFPVLATESDVCRDELLFEIELDAMSVFPGAKTGKPRAKKLRTGERRV